MMNTLNEERLLTLSVKPSPAMPEVFQKCTTARRNVEDRDERSMLMHFTIRSIRRSCQAKDGGSKFGCEKN